MLAEAFAPTIGLYSPPDGCGYSGARQMRGTFKVLEKTGSVQETAYATACDLVTLDSEFFKLKTIIPYSYRVLENGTWENGGRSLDEINDPDLATGERIKRVIEVQNAMAEDPGLIQAAVASEDFGSGRNYLYLFTKDQNDKSKINALAIEHQGNQDEFRILLRALAPGENDSIISFDNPLFFHRHNQVLLSDVLKGVLDSYKDPTRREEMKPYLTRLTYDVADFPNLLIKHQQAVEALTEKFREEILSNEDVVTGLSAVVYGINHAIEDWISQDKQGYQARLGVRAERSPEEMKSVVFREASKEAFPRERRMIKQVIDPIAPALIGLIHALASVKEESIGLSGRETKEAPEGKNKKDSRKEEDNETGETKAWQKMIKILFGPILKEMEEAKPDKDRAVIQGVKRGNGSFGPVEVKAESLEAGNDSDVITEAEDQVLPSDGELSINSQSEEVKRDFIPHLLDNLPRFIEREIWGIDRDEIKEETKDRLQILLGILLADNEADGEDVTLREDPSQFTHKHNTEKLPFPESDLEIIESTQAIVGKDSKTLLLLLLEIYNGSGEKNEIRGFIAALIYHELKQQRAEDWLNISPQEIEILEKRIVLLRKKLMQFLRIPLDCSYDLDHKLLSVLYSLTPAMLGLDRIEVLFSTSAIFPPVEAINNYRQYDKGWLIERLNNLGQHPFKKKLSKKKGRKLPFYATLFYYHLIYQYQDTCHQGLNMPQ